MIREGFLSHIRSLNEEDSRLSEEGVGRIWPKDTQSISENNS